MKKGALYIFFFAYALLDAQTVVKGASEGVQLALTVVIPSLFPFIFLSVLSSHCLSGGKPGLLRPVEKLCGMPSGSGCLLLLGLCGGYPVGAQCVVNACEQGSISREDGQRLLGFCNNAGPSFIFGMVGGIFKDYRLCWLLWLGQIFSAVIVGTILPGKSKTGCRLQQNNGLTVAEGLQATLGICGKIAGWIILFRVLLTVADKWLLYNFSSLWQAGIAGILELSNGCIRLQNIDVPLPKFLLCGAMLAFGGFCVHLQTKSVVKILSLKTHFIGKVLQMLIILPILLILWKITVAF